MDYRYNSHINKLIKQGILPPCQLASISLETTKTFDFFEKGKDTLIYFKNNPKSLYDPIGAALRACSIGEYQLQAFNFESPLNLVINTAYNPAILSDKSSAYQEAIQLCPIVTDIDQALYSIILTYAVIIPKTADEDKADIEEVFFAWLYLLKAVQENEYIFDKTLDFPSLSDTSPVLEILLSPWNEQNLYARFVDLTDSESTAIKNLECTRKELKKRFAEEISSAMDVAVETDCDWKLFLRILNDYSEKEKNAIDRVCDTQLSNTEKITAIETYFSVLQDNANEQHMIDGNVVNITPIIEAAKKRLQYAPSYCLVRDDSGQSFILHPYASELVTFPMTFNLLLLSYHQFRLDPQQGYALLFCNFALHYLKRNLSFVAEDCTYDSIETLAEEFHQEFYSFVDTNRDHIDELSFDDIQQNSVFLGNAALNDIASTVLNNHFSDKINILLSSLGNTDLTNVAQVEHLHYSNEDLEAQLAEAQDFARKEKSKIIARQVVVSLNIVYLFCDALKIISDDCNCHSFVDNLDVIDECREDLQDIHTGIARKVYTKKVKLSKYRRETGIDADALTKQEHRAEERLQRNTFVGLLSKYLSGINVSIHKRSIEGLLDVNRRFRTEILRCPIFIDEEEHIRDLEKVSNEICNSLVKVFEAESPEKLKIEKQAILSELGPEAQSLPELTIKSLATAELLFHKYANKKYQIAGFDYSSISALYYQAFEHAYNSLIWQKYAERLDSIQINGQPFAEYLFECNRNKENPTDEIAASSARGYLPHKLASASQYIDDDKDSLYFKKALTFRLFSQLLFGISGKTLDKLCDYFAEMTGFSNRQSMFEDESFMEYVAKFARKTNKKTKNRNKASHGGTEINFNTCSGDKKAVLFDLETVRDDSISLIQLLLYLVSYNKT